MRLIKISGAHRLADGLFLFKTEVAVGTVSTHKDGLQYMKIAPNKWAPVKKGAKGEHEFDEGRHGIHITKNAKGEAVQGKLTDATKEHVKAAIAEKMKKEVADKEKGQHQETHIEKKKREEGDFAEGDVVRAKKGSAKAKDDEKLEGIVGKVMKIKERIVEIKNEAGKVFEVPRGMLAFVKARRRKDLIPGGKGDKLEVSDVDAKQLEMGIAEEMEHTGDRKLAEEIALDHLSEDPKYYSKLKTVFKAGKIGLIPKIITVVRGGKSFKTTVYVAPGDVKNESALQKKAEDDSLGDISNLNIVKYTDKAFAIVGDTMKNVVVMRALREHLKIGGWNSMLKGWLFPMTKLAAAKEFLNAHLIPLHKDATAEEKKEIAEQQATLDFDLDSETTVEGKTSAEEKKEIGKPIDTTTGKVEVEEGKSADGKQRKPRAKKVENVESPGGFVDVGAKIGGAKKDIRALSRQYELEKTQAMSRADLEQLEADSPAVAQQLINKNRQLGVESLQEYMLHLKDDGVEYAAAVMIKRLVGAIANKCEDSPEGRQQYLAAFERFNLAAQSWKTLPEVLSGMQSFKDDLSGIYVPDDLMSKYNEAKDTYTEIATKNGEFANSLTKEMTFAGNLKEKYKTSKMWKLAIDNLIEKNPKYNPKSGVYTDIFTALDKAYQLKGYRSSLVTTFFQYYLHPAATTLKNEFKAPTHDQYVSALATMKEIQEVGKQRVIADASSNYNIMKSLGQDFGIAVGVYPRATAAKHNAWVKTNARWRDKVTSIQEERSEDGINNWGDYEGKVKDPTTGEKKPKGPAQPKMQWPRIEDMTSDTVVRTGATEVTYNDSKKLLNDFGFRGIEYGTWMDTPTSKEHTQRCGEALHDLSAILGIDKTELSLNGRLSLAFGARGSGGKRAAAAHYESGRKVINLTKFAGGGSLAHEWGHALDNVLALVASGGKSHVAFLSVDSDSPKSHNNYDQLPESIKGAYKELDAAMTEGTFRPKTKFFVEHNPERKWSRLDGAQKMLDAAGGDANKAMANYVATQVERADAAYRSYISYGYGKDQAEKNRTSYLNKARKSAKIQAEALADLSKTNVSYLIPTGEPQSQYKATSEAQGKKYWGSKVEMFARAWESFVHDELKDRGIENTYLVGAGVSRAGWEKYNKGRGGAMYRSFYGEDAVYSIYPLGEERDRINNGFRRLIAAVKEHNMLQKAIRILDAEKMLLKAGRQPGEFAWCGGKPVVMLQPGDISQVLSMDLNGHPTIEYFEAVDVMSPKMLKAAPALMLRLTKFYEDYKRIKPGSSDVVDTELQKAGHGTAGLVRVKKTTTDGVSRYYWIRTDDKHETSHHVADSKKKSPDVNTSWHQHMTPSDSEYSKIVSGDKNVLGTYMHRVFFNQNNNAGSSLVNAVTKNLTRSIHTIGFDPEDIVMETILRVMDKQDKKQLTAEKVPRNKMGVFVAQVFKNVASEMMKRRHVEKEVADDVNTFADTIADTSSPDEPGITDNDVTGAQQQAHEVVQAVLDDMPTRNRERNQQIFKDYLAGKTHKEIADKHGITELASKKAVAKLNERVSAEMQRRGIELSRKKVKVVSASGTFKAALNWLMFDLFKARDVSKLTKKVIVNRRGHKQTVWIRVQDGQPVAATSNSATIADLQIQPYSAKSIVVKGNTLKHVSTLRALRSKLGIGGWNQTIGGWIFPATKADAVAQFLHGAVAPQSPDGQRVLKEVEKETAKQEAQIVESGREGILSKAFKSWFGDWQKGEGSKVVDKNFEPQEQTNIDVAPEVVYHGTAVGGFSEFKIGATPGIYGKGLYFTADKSIAKEYAETKDSASTDRVKRATGVIDAVENPVKFVPFKFVKEYFDRVKVTKPREFTRDNNPVDTDYLSKQKQEFQEAFGDFADYEFGKEGITYDNPNWHDKLASVLARSTDKKNGLDVDKFFSILNQENPKWYNDWGGKFEQAQYGADRERVGDIIGKFFSDVLKNNNNYQPKIANSQIFEVYLNIKNPMVMEHEVSRSDYERYISEAKKIGKNGWGLYLDDILNHKQVEAVGLKSESVQAANISYDTMLKIKQTLRNYEHEKTMEGTQYYSGHQKGDKVWPIFQQTPAEKLTWGDIQYITSNAQQDRQTFADLAKAMGHDGLSHLGGWNIGTKPHRVWIAFDPKQVKATTAKEFDSNSADIYKARDTSKLTKKTITNRAGKKQTVWVRTGQDMPGEKKKKKDKSGGKPGKPTGGKKEKMGMLKKIISAMKSEKDPVKKRSMFKNTLKGIFDSTSATFAGRSGGDVAAESVQSTAEIGKSNMEAKKAAAEKKAASAELNAGATKGSKK